MKRGTRGILCVVAVLLVATPSSAQGQQEMSAEEAAMMEAFMAAGTPGQAHAMLAATAGTYELAITSWPGPGAPPVKDTGTAVRSMALDGRVLVEEVQASMMGMPFTGHGMTGYDNVSGKYWATWNDSMTTGILVSHGDCDDNGVCAFTGTWNDPISKQPTNGRFTVEPNANGEIFTMYGPGPDGKEMKMMEIVYVKKNAD